MNNFNFMLFTHIGHTAVLQKELVKVYKMLFCSRAFVVSRAFLFLKTTTLKIDKAKPGANPRIIYFSILAIA